MWHSEARGLLPSSSLQCSSSPRPAGVSYQPTKRAAPQHKLAGGRNEALDDQTGRQRTSSIRGCEEGVETLKPPCGQTGPSFIHQVPFSHGLGWPLQLYDTGRGKLGWQLVSLGSIQIRPRPRESTCWEAPEHPRGAKRTIAPSPGCPSWAGPLSGDQSPHVVLTGSDETSPWCGGCRPLSGSAPHLERPQH